MSGSEFGKADIMNDTRYTLERFTAPICDGGGQGIAVVDTTKGDDDCGRYVATFSQGWDTSAQEYADKLNAEIGRPAMTPQRAARITHDARNAEHPHMSFAEQVDAGHPDPMPCGCWHAGRRDEIRGLRRDQVFHPRAFGDGWLSAYEEANDV